MKNSSRLALAAVIAALAVTVMMLSIFPFVTYALPGIAGALMIIVVIEVNKKWAVGVYAVSGILSLLLAPDKEAALFYIFLLGYYPILKSVFEKLKSRTLEYILKLAVFNVSAITATFIAIKMFAIPIESIPLLGKYSGIAFLLLGNIIFVLYDKLLNGLATQYLVRIHPYIKRLFR